MVAIDWLAFGLAAALTLLAVGFHLLRGTPWEPSTDVAGEVLERRRATLPETDFPEPMNRALGGGVAAAPAAGMEAGELAQGGGETEAEAAADSGPGDVPDEEADHYDVEFVKEGETLDAPSNRTILERGEEEGWDLPYACREGHCLSCAARVTDGGSSEDYVVHDGQEMLDDDELGEGYTLTCVAYPKSEFSLETGEAP